MRAKAGRATEPLLVWSPLVAVLAIGMIVAATLAHSILDPSQPKSQSALCATGFRDTTRIASGSPEMWRDICLDNRAEVLAAIDLFLDEASRLTREADRIARFREVEEIAADQVWTISIATPPPRI